MSLGRLLAAGKSLVSSSDDGARYRLSKQSLLPKFISPKNPFAPGEGAAKPAKAERLVKPAVKAKSISAGAMANSATVTKPIGVPSNERNDPPVAERKFVAATKPVVNGPAVAKAKASEKQKKISVRG